MGLNLPGHAHSTGGLPAVLAGRFAFSHRGRHPLQRFVDAWNASADVETVGRCSSSWSVLAGWRQWWSSLLGTMGCFGIGRAWHCCCTAVDCDLLWIVGALAQAPRVVGTGRRLCRGSDLEPGKWLASISHWGDCFAAGPYVLGFGFSLEPAFTPAKGFDVERSTDVDRRCNFDVGELRF